MAVHFPDTPATASFAVRREGAVPTVGVRAATVPLSWASWKLALALLLAVFVLRVGYLRWLSPWELVGDEAYYWVQGRHLDLCYDKKGPALPWLVAASCKAFGDTEFAVRLPMAFASLLASWAIGKLAMSAADGDERVGFFAVAAFLLIP